ncbi:MAG: tRNA uridine-5-carboxymethylaminomethyl(34) synthesis GTPase MnmE [Candidatus Brocadiia bacterium]
MVRPEDTIIAIATPAGNSLKGIIRLSGPKTFRIIKGLFSPRLTDSYCKSHGKTIEGTLQLKGMNTPAALYLMKSPHSYTREDAVEIHTIGAEVLLQEIVRQFLAKGARLAQPGEFTRRAYLNGRINLAQAEAVLDIIKSQNERELALANKQLQNHFAKRVTFINSRLLDLISRIELSLDFSDQDFKIIQPEEIKTALKYLTGQLGSMLKSQEQSQTHKEGVVCVLFGRTNAGKSNIFNRLVPDKKNIVSPVAGTTRDYIEGVYTHGGKRFIIFDTAGMTGVPDNRTKQSRRLANQTLGSADIRIMVIDGHRGITKNDRALSAKLDAGKSIIALNKCDLSIKSNAAFGKTCVVRTSARTGQGITALKEALVKLVSNNQIDRSSSDITVNNRHRNCLDKTLSSLKHALSVVDKEQTYELVALDLREALDSLGQITGQSVTDDILNNIFSRFCIGK